MVSASLVRYRLLFTVFVLLLFVLLVWQAEKYISVGVPRTLVLYCFSALDDAMDEGILPAFRNHWRETSGEDVEFIATYAGSGTITDRILKRFPAEVALLSSELDALQLSRSGIFVNARQRQELPDRGVFARSPFVILVREGNPKGILDFSDLARPNVSVIHADPLTSGAGQWAILSVYGSALDATGSNERASETLLSVWRNVIRQGASARITRELFEQGVGDATITYEQQALSHPHRLSPSGEIVRPPRTMLGEHVVVKLEKNIENSQRDLVDAFVDFLWSLECQEILVAYGFRSVDEELNAAQKSVVGIERALTLEALGGPRRAKEDIIEGVWQARVLKELEAAR